MSSFAMANGKSGKVSGNESRGNLVHYYLVAYNFLQTIGWILIFSQLVTYYLSSGSKSLYDTLKFNLHIFQNAAVLEVIHAATGIVRSSAIMTAFQVASRVVVVCGVMMITNAAKECTGLPLAVLAWSITEIIRYSNYTFNLVWSVPYVLKFLRYTTFIVLYPIGVTGELLCIWAAQKEVGAGNLYSLTMPNKYNFIFNYQHLLWYLMLLYIPLFPQLYLYMFGQRKKALGTKKDKAN